MKTALIFGANGQDGYYLNKICQQNSIRSIAVSRTGKGIIGDISHYEQVNELVKTYLPTYVFHLAANSTPQHYAIFENHETISTGTLNILEAVKNHSPESKVFITGSGLQFKNTGNPISENDEFEASSPYSIARIHSVYAARYYRSLGIRTYIGYLFHHESPLRTTHHVSQLIASAVGRISIGSKEIIELGDISVAKEWTFAGDVARAVYTFIEQDNVFEAVIGSGAAYTIQDWLDACFKVIGKDWHKHIRFREGFIPEYKRLVSNPLTIRNLGWYPKIAFPDLAEMMVIAKKSNASKSATSTNPN